MGVENRDQLLNKQPNLFDTEFRADEEQASDADLEELMKNVSGEEAQAWIDSLPEVPEVEIPRIDKIIFDALDRIRISHQRHLPSNN